MSTSDEIVARRGSLRCVHSTDQAEPGNTPRGPTREELRDRVTNACIKIEGLADALLATMMADDEDIYTPADFTLDTLVSLIHELAREGTVAGCELKGLDDKGAASTGGDQ